MRRDLKERNRGRHPDVPGARAGLEGRHLNLPRRQSEAYRGVFEAQLKPRSAMGCTETVISCYKSLY